ncbi:chitin synthase-domain-containing protein [Dichotomocladium elegans]|nr:chitin synthase-domain-containing protein [Dichotomocladium elegans]
MASTSRNAHASHLSQCQTLYFNEKGRILGSYTAIYLLDKFRVTAHPATFDLFYQLLAGTTAQEKAALHINHPADHFAYLRDPQGHQLRAAAANSLNGSPLLAARDEIAFGDFKASLKACGFKSKTIAQICQLLAAILHLGSIQFISSSANDNCRIKNKDTLSLVAAALGVATPKLESTLTHKLKLLGKEFCTAFLTVQGATQQRDALARTLYTILVFWIVDQLNKNHPHLHQTSDHRIHILDPAAGGGGGGASSTDGVALPFDFADLCAQFCEERLYRFRHYHEPSGAAMDTLIPILNRESERLQAYALDATDANFLTLISKKVVEVNKEHRKFVIQHYHAPVEYSVDGFLENNLDLLSPDFILLFRYSCTNAFLRELFESPLIVTETHPRDERTIIKAQLSNFPASWHRTDDDDGDNKSQLKQRKIETVMDQMVNSIDTLGRTLISTRLFEILHVRPNDMQKPGIFDPISVQTQLRKLLLSTTNDNASSDMYRYSFTEFLSRYPFLGDMLPDKDGGNVMQRLIHMMQWTDRQVQLQGMHHVLVSFDVWRDLENHLRMLEKEERIRERERRMMEEAERAAAEAAAAAAAATAAAAAEEEEEARLQQEAEAADMAVAETADAEHQEEYNGKHSDETMDCDNPFNDPDDGRSDIYTDHDIYDDRTEVDDRLGSEIMGKHSGSQWGEDDEYIDGYGPNMDMSKMMEDTAPAEELIEVVPISSIRRWWARFVWFCTWWIPSCLLRWVGKMHRQDVRMAWREKVTLCMLIFMFSASIIFFIVGLGDVLCPGTNDLYTPQDVVGHQTINDYWISVRGKVYDMTRFVASSHGTTTYMATKSTLEPLAGRDLTYTFPPPLTQACAGLVTDDSVTIMPNETIVLGPFVHFSGGQQTEKSIVNLRDPEWITRYFMPVMDNFKRGDLVVSKKQLEDDFKGWGRLALALDGKVYDLTDYMATARRYPRDATNMPNYHYLSDPVESLFQKFAGTDATSQWGRFAAKMDETTRARNLACLNNVFYVGKLDHRESLRCTFVNYLLLSFAVVMTLVVLVKFLAALQFGGAPTPEDQDKFVICQVPCYTEGEESLRKTIDSLTTMNYDDKRKLLFLIADGMIIGSGNDKPTPMILLDILGHDDKEDPEPVMFKSVGEGSKQLNYGKVYSGLYMHEGHTVPYIVVVKVGKSTEQNKPGNRGKRDSQIICMDFLRKVHFDADMSPLELKIYHNIRNVIGVDPKLYEYILMVDSDTEVYPDALTRLVSCMLHDSRIIGLCGETELCNEDMSWTTRIQVYEYYISHHLVKAFESLFGSVTCLPGCFCMYRIRTANKRQPLIVSPAIIRGYSDNQVDTLHKKNLLHLGEDRYLTTLMMKNFPQYKITFTPYARCRTVAPDSWQILLSQRRRWINSTIHNLLELILLPELCGFCCLSMRFVVMIDLIGTITLPASVVYLIYLMYIVASSTGPIPVIALGMLAGAYGLQALIFIVKRQWQHIGWMVIYLLAIPVFSFLIPIYSFWHFDDFSWGNTRVVVGDKQKQIIVTEDEKFDDKMIPMKKWAQYEKEMEALAEQQQYDDDDGNEAYEDDDRTAMSRYTGGSGADEMENIDLRSEHSGVAQHNHSNNMFLVPHLATGLSERDLSEFSMDLSAALFQQQQQQQPTSPQQRGNIYGDDGALTSTTPSPLEASKPILPEDDEIEREIRHILIGANLMELTKKQARDQLSQRFGVDLTIKKGFINATIERILTEGL